jgi:class 3 adenylate cyclase
MSERPTGTVTFVFTDIEGSTEMLGRLGEDYGDLLFAHHALLRDVWYAHGGSEVSTDASARSAAGSPHDQTPMSSFQSSGRAATKLVIMAMHSSSSTIVICTPFSASHS